MAKILTLTGFLGRDREIRDTRERTRTVTTWNFIAEEQEEYEVTTPTREYAVLSLATHRDGSVRRETTWHRLIVWDVDRVEWFNVRLARKGDRVKIWGYEETITLTDEDGRESQLRQFVVIKYECREKAFERRPRRAE